MSKEAQHNEGKPGASSGSSAPLKESSGGSAGPAGSAGSAGPAGPAGSGLGEAPRASDAPGTSDPQADSGEGAEATRLSSGVVLRGATVSPGLALGPVHRKDYDLERAAVSRITPDEVDRELNRFRGALDDSRVQIQDLKSRLKGRVPEDDARILDTHATYLRDSVFIADVENLILTEQMRLDAAIAKVVSDFDRIFRLVQSETLRQSAIDLRDVGIRVLRNLEQKEGLVAGQPEQDAYVLVARELSIVDMFTLANEHVKGIVTQEGGLTSHAAVFARSMRIPTVTGVEGLLDQVAEGAFVILDATEGILRVNPDERVREQYELSVAEAVGEDEVGGEIPEWAMRPVSTRDGEAVQLGASCGNVPEVEQAAQLGMEQVGLYRTELLFLIDQTPPSLEALTQHYTTVIGAARGAQVTFRLLSVDSGMGIPYMHGEPERNPSLGQVGVRALLANPSLLRRQIQAILLAGREADLRIALPFVTDCGDLRRVKEILFEERFELRKQGEISEESVPIGVVLETPAAMLGVRDLAQESEFLMLNLDALQQYILATDRENEAFASRFESLHPFVLRALIKVSEVAQVEHRPLWVFGAATIGEDNLPFLIGAGLRHFCIQPSDLRAFLATLDEIDSKAVTRDVRIAARSSCDEETRSLVSGYRHGFARS